MYYLLLSNKAVIENMTTDYVYLIVVHYHFNRTITHNSQRGNI